MTQDTPQLTGFNDWVIVEEIEPPEEEEDPESRYNRWFFYAIPRPWFDEFSADLAERGFRPAGNLAGMYATEFILPEFFRGWHQHQGKVYSPDVPVTANPSLTPFIDRLVGVALNAIDRDTLDSVVFDIEKEGEMERLREDIEGWAYGLRSYEVFSGVLWAAQLKDLRGVEKDPYDGLTRATWFYLRDPDTPDLVLRDNQIVAAEGDNENLAEQSELFKGGYLCKQELSVRKVGDLKAPFNKLNRIPKINLYDPYPLVSSLSDKDRKDKTSAQVTHVLHPLYEGMHVYMLTKLDRTPSGNYTIYSDIISEGLLERLESTGIAIRLDTPIEADRRDLHVTDQREIYVVGQDLNPKDRRNKEWWEVFDPNHVDNILVGSY